MQGEMLIRRLMLTLPNYAAAGRHMDGWIIAHSASLMLEKPEGVVGLFLLAMFMHGVWEWNEQREKEQDALLMELGVSLEEMRRRGHDGFEAPLQEIMKRPDKAEVITKFYAKHRELEAMWQAQYYGSAQAALDLLKREEARALYLSMAEVLPWLRVLDERIREAPEGFVSLMESQSTDESTEKAFANLLNSVTSEMAGAVFTPARLAQLKSQLHQWRIRLSIERDRETLIGVHGALIAIQTQSHPQENHFLMSLCRMSLRATLESMMKSSGEEQE
jgi:hypothetical protein